MISDGVKAEDPKHKKAVKQACENIKAEYKKMEGFVLADHQAGRISEEEAMTKLDSLKEDLRFHLMNVLGKIE